MYTSYLLGFASTNNDCNMKRQGLWYASGNLVAATFLCLNIVFLSAAGAPVTVSGLDADKQTRRSFPDISFGIKLEIINRTVSCSGEVQGSSYPSPMYTCRNISVDGEKLYHGYATEGNRRREGCNTGCPCGNNQGRPNDIQALCTEMLKAHGVAEPLTAAYVVKPSCSAADKPGKRVKLYYDDEGKPVWEDVQAPNGYINTLQCLTAKQSPKS